MREARETAGVPPAELQEYEASLREAGADLRPYTFLQRQQALASSNAAGQTSDAASTGWQTALMKRARQCSSWRRRREASRAHGCCFSVVPVST